MLALALATVLFLIVLNGIFAMSELAIVTSKKTKLQGRAERGDRGAKTALLLANEPNRFLSAVQVGITLIGIFAGAFGQATIASELNQLIDQSFPSLAAYSEAVSTIIVVLGLTYVSLIIGELVPKRLAMIFPETIAGIMSGPMSWVAWVMTPFVLLLTASTAGILKIMGIKHEQGEAITQDEVEITLAEGMGAGLIEPEEQAIMTEVMRLGDRPVRAAMTPRTDVYWVSVDDPSETLSDEIRSCPYSRFVVTRDQDMDNPIGVVHKRDVADLLLSGKSLDLESLIREPIFIPDTSSLLKSMELFRASRTHIAFVINEFGGFEGLLTLTDLMEMMAGDFNEAHDDDRKMVIVREDGSWLVDGRTDLVDLGLALNTNFTSDGGYHTIAGMILHELERFPQEGETLNIGAFHVEVIDMDERRIDKVMIKKRG